MMAILILYHLYIISEEQHCTQLLASLILMELLSANVKILFRSEKIRTFQVLLFRKENFRAKYILLSV